MRAIRSRGNVVRVVSAKVSAEYTPTSIPCAGSRFSACRTMPDIRRESRASPVEKSRAKPSSTLPSFRSLMASPKSMVYVVLGRSVSRKSTVRLRPLELTCGGVFCAGDTTTLLNASSSCMFSSKVTDMRVRSTLRAPGAGLERTNFGGSSSRAPPSGRPMLAHAARRHASTHHRSRRM